MAPTRYLDPDLAELERLREQAPEKFMEQLFKAYYTPLCRTVYRLVRDEAIAEDIVQEMFMKVWNGRDRLDLSRSPMPYLQRAATNGALNFLERTRKAEVWDHEVAERASGGINTTQETLDGQEVQERINAALESLPPRCQAVFLLSRQEELSYQEIADRMGLSIKTIENQMGKALRLLREQLKDYMHLLGSFLL